MSNNSNNQQPEYVEKRVRYFDGQYLQVQDFVDEQQYQIDRLRRLSHFLHVSGIVDGLKAEANANSLAVTISPGTAIDPDGRQILLNTSYFFNNEEFPKPGETSSNKQGAELNLQPYKNQKEHELFIVYDERETDKQDDVGSENYKRFHERPKIEVLPSKEQLPTGYKGVRLAKLNIEDNTVNVDNTVRQYSGLRLPGAENSEVTLRLQRQENENLAVLTGSLSISGALEVKGGSTLTGNVKANGSLTVTNKGKGWIAEFTQQGLGDGVRISGVKGENNALNICNNTTDVPTLTVTNNGTGETLYVEKQGSGLAAKFKGKVEANGDAELTGNLTVKGQTQLNSALKILEDTTLEKNMSVKGKLTTMEGRIGIGTDTPKSQLEIRKDNKGGLGPILTLSNSLGYANAGAAIDFNGYDVKDHDPTARIRSLDDNHSSHLVFYTKQPGSPTNTLQERLRIQSDGNILATGDIKIKENEVTAAVEKLMIISGRVDREGNRKEGKGFTVEKIQDSPNKEDSEKGLFQIKFSRSFSGIPTVVSTQYYNNSFAEGKNGFIGDFNQASGKTTDNVVVVAVDREKLKIKTGNGSGEGTHREFGFIAIGLR